MYGVYTPHSLRTNTLLGKSANALANEALAWTASISRSRVSTADSLGLSENVDSGAMNSLESLLRIVQQLKLNRVRAEEIEEIQFIAAGETFSVSQCHYEGKVVAIKRIRLNEEESNSDRQHFQRRLQSVLREILILSHPPIAHHPNIISFLGYGWSMKTQQVSPFISLEFASGGSLRTYMKDQKRSIRTKLILIGDVGAGLMALHKCGIVHGDLKADNVVVFSSLDRPSMSIAKVSDFGHSILMSSASEEKSKYVGTTLLVPHGD
jgi:serine/threonine protein kinase